MANAEAHYRSVVNKPAHGTSARWHAGCHCVYAGYRLFLIFAASSVCAAANVRTIADANAAGALGVGAVTEGFAGQTTMTKLGLSAG